MHPVTGVDPLRGIADLKINATAQSGPLLEDWEADFFRNTGIYGGLIDHNGAFAQAIPTI
jgi:sorbitol-specific phosphotransferase system component IIBC